MLSSISVYKSNIFNVYVLIFGIKQRKMIDMPPNKTKFNNLDTVTCYQLFQDNSNNLYSILWFQVAISNLQ